MRQLAEGIVVIPRSFISVHLDIWEMNLVCLLYTRIDSYIANMSRTHWHYKVHLEIRSWWETWMTKD